MELGSEEGSEEELVEILDDEEEEEEFSLFADFFRFRFPFFVVSF